MADHTCLFTGEVLTDQTREEHTIPVSMCGRIKSRIVSCDEFNHRSGCYLDEILKLVYEPVLNHLSPLLPSAAQPGRMKIEVEGQPPGLILENGRIDRANVAVVKRDELGRPQSLVSSGEKAPMTIANQLGKNREDIGISWTPATHAASFTKKIPVICHEVELAVLKSILLTFDHVLCGSEHRFTRDERLKDVRHLVQDAVMSRTVSPQLLASVSLGLQYEKLPFYQQIREQVDEAQTPFEHFLLVVANAPSRCIDVVWLVFGFDPFGFRLCRDWQSEPFCYAVVNPVLKGKSWSGAHSICLIDDLLCAPTNRCSTPATVSSDHEMEAIMEVISYERGRAFCNAIELVEMTCDEHVIECLTEAAFLSGAGERSVAAQLLDRLIRVYGRKKSDPEFMTKVSEFFCERSKGVPNEILNMQIECRASLSADDLQIALSLYRSCLSDLKAEFGTPGDWFRSSCGIIADPADERLIGDLPKTA